MIVDDSRRRTKFMAQRAAAAAAGRARAGGRAQRRRGFRSSRARWLLICSAQCTFLDIRVKVIFVTTRQNPNSGTRHKTGAHHKKRAGAPVARRALVAAVSNTP